MKRRNFVHNSAVGVLGYNLINPGLNSLQLFNETTVQSWLQHLIQVTGVSRKSAKAFLSGQAAEVIGNLNSHFLKR